MKPKTESARDEKHLPAWILEGVAFAATLPDGRPNAAERTHLDACEHCQSVVAHLRAARHQFLAEQPEEAFFANVRQRCAKNERFAGSRPLWPIRWRTRLWLSTASVAGAFVATLILLGPSDVADTGARKPTVRLRGNTPLSLSLFASRNGKIAEPFNTANALRAGDLIRFGVMLPGTGYIYVVNLDEEGHFSLYFPRPGPSHQRRYSPQEGVQVLPGSIELDSYVGREAIYLLLSDKPLSGESLKRAFVKKHRRRHFPAPDEIDLSAQITRQIIIKEQRH